MIVKNLSGAAYAATIALMMAAGPPLPAFAQEQTAAAAQTTPDAQAPEPLSEDELEVLVARIALYPDELVALISGASLYPLQIVEAARFLDDYAKDKSLKPKDTWDGSVISLLNYPDIVKMMSDDLDWTQELGDALAYQQKDVLIAIQQLRDEAVAKNIIKSDDKVKVVTQNDNVLIQSTNPERVYVPRYEPEMLYVPDYPPAPIAYYPDPYPNYYYPSAPFFAAAVTGVLWAAAVDWDDWGVWGGRWNGGDVDIDCNNCLNNRNFNGRANFNDIDWKNVDRSKINIDRNQFANLDRTNIRNNIKENRGNNIRDRAANIRNERPSGGRGGANVNDIRKSTLEGLRNRPGGGAGGINRPNIGQGDRPNIGQGNRPNAGNRPNIGQGNRPNVGQGNRPSVGQGNRPNVGQGNRPGKGNVSRPSGKRKPAARADNRPRKASGLGNVDRGRVSKVNSNRGRQSMGGGSRGRGGGASRGGGGHRAVSRGGRGGGGGGRGGGRGGGGRRR
jgi:Protein of unknown function (DUF3300)